MPLLHRLAPTAKAPGGLRLRVLSSSPSGVAQYVKALSCCWTRRTGPGRPSMESKRDSPVLPVQKTVARRGMIGPRTPFALTEVAEATPKAPVLLLCAQQPLPTPPLQTP